jgi:hypothetical protein
LPDPAPPPRAASLPTRQPLLSRDREGAVPDLLITAALFLASLLLLGPWLTTDLSNQPWNNAYIYTAIARLFRDHASPWNPFQYAGSPFHFLYPPLFPTFTALLRFLPIGRAFHIAAGIGYALAPPSLYVLARALFRTRLPAIFAGLAFALFPSLMYLLPQLRPLGQPFAYAPWNFIALVAYDEAPHAFALPFLFLAVAAAWRERWGPASILAGCVLLTSWPGMIGLAFPLAGLAIARRRTIPYVLSLAGAAYGIAAFWITPSYFVASQLFNRIVWRHTTEAAPWTAVTWALLAAALLAVCLCFWKRIPPELALPLVWTALAALVVIGNFLLPLPHRYLLELSAGLALLLAALLSRAPRAVIPIAIAAGLVLSFRFVTHAWKFDPPAADPTTGVAYQTAAWLKDHAQGGRVLVSGELDSTLSLWTDVPQIGGPGQAARNYLVLAAERQIALGCGADSEPIAELWLRALNAPWLVVHGPASREYFHWYTQPEKFATLPIAWDNGADDRVYRLPNFEPHEAVVVDLPAPPAPTSTADPRWLTAYVNWAAGKRPVNLHWISSGQADFDVNLAANEAVLLKINHDPGWRSSGATIAADPIGFQLIRPQPGVHHVALRYGASWDTWLGRAITILTILLILARIKLPWIAAMALIPAVAAWAVLLSGIPPTAQAAEEAFVRLHPPLINSGGIAITQNVMSIYGSNLSGSNTRVWIGNRSLQPEFTSPTQVNVRLPAGLPPTSTVSVEVNGCTGNAFSFPTR